MEVLGVDRVKRTFFLFLIFDFFLFLFIADSKENERSFHTFPLELGRLFAPIREGRIPRDQVSISLSLSVFIIIPPKLVMALDTVHNSL